MNTIIDQDFVVDSAEPSVDWVQHSGSKFSGACPQTTRWTDKRPSVQFFVVDMKPKFGGGDYRTQAYWSSEPGLIGDAYYVLPDGTVANILSLPDEPIHLVAHGTSAHSDLDVALGLDWGQGSLQDEIRNAERDVNALINELRSGVPVPRFNELEELADNVLNHLKHRQTEDVDTWAARLASDWSDVAD